MRKIHSASCSLLLLLIVGSMGPTWQEKVKNKGSYSVPLRRTKRDLRDSRGNPTENLKGRPGQGYYISTDLGSPPLRINVLVDTGSSNFAVAASPHPYLPFYFRTDKSTSYQDQNRRVAVPYTQGNWEGELGSDLLRFVEGPNATVRVNVAAIQSSENFYINGSMWEGILGLGYARLSKPDSSVLPVFDQFVNAGVVKDSFSMQLCGSSEIDLSSEPTVAGTMVFGEVDNELYEGDLLFTPVVKKWYYEVVITDIAVGGESLALDCKKYNYDKTIVDSGTTNLRVSEEVFDAILDRLKKFDKLGVPDEFWIGRQMMCWNYDKTPWEEFPDMSISLLSTISNSKEFRLKIPPQLYLRETIERGPLPGQHCYKFAITKADKGTVIGAVIMEGFYVVFDRENVQVGFAATTCGAEGRLNPSSEVSGPFSRDAVDCEYIETESSDTALLTVAYVMAGVCGLCLLPIFVLLAQASCKRKKQHERLPQSETAHEASDTANLRDDF
ncbi:beta-secretase 1-like [Pocillopora damicornis]|uniref:beta-secretase 1-like n=1 Tax=Pocillopora damicornis TaxID=46731 RepID=UPI000F54CE82|nr:beta-secretase 1-like [Pocillopora damicornis]